MIPVGFLQFLLFDFLKKRIKNKTLLTVLYFIVFGILWMIVCILLCVFIMLKDLISRTIEPAVLSNFIPTAAVTGLLLGELFAFFPWLIWLRKEDPVEK